MPLIDGGCVTIELARDVEAFLHEQVRAGACTSPSELVNDVIRSLRELQQMPFKTTPEPEAWLLESADKPSTPLIKKDFDAIRERVRSRTSSSVS
jgi:Arc/MetJ-type ribon-helix-helix transcriptional regulator